jgi:hypothetical protein
MTLARCRSAILLIGALDALVASSGARACEEPHLSPAVELGQVMKSEIEAAALECAFQDDFCVPREVVAIFSRYRSRIDELPPSCQELVSKIIGGGGGEPPLCTDGVCCDSTGCYGP